MNNNNTTSTLNDNIQFIYNEIDNTNNNIGWVCPKCGRSINPSNQTCPYCHTQHTDEGLAPGEQMICDSDVL